MIRRFDWWPQLAVVIVTPSTTLDTVSADFTGQADLGPQFDRIIAGLDEAVMARDGAAFAKAATESAAFNQQFIPNHLYDVLAEEYESLGADGLNVAHTGTCLGLLFVLPERSGAMGSDALGGAARKASIAVRRLNAMLPGDVTVDLSLTPACSGVAEGGAMWRRSSRAQWRRGNAARLCSSFSPVACRVKSAAANLGVPIATLYRWVPAAERS